MEGQLSMFGQESECGRMCPERSAAESQKAATSRRSSRRSCGLKNHRFMLLDLRPDAGNMLGPCWEYDPAWLGPPGMLDTSECPKNVVESSLSQILEAIAPSKFSLYKKACLGILRRSDGRGKPLPPELKTACMIQAGLIPMPDCGLVPLPLDIQAESFTAGFCAGAGASAGSIAYQKESAPTLKGSPSGNMMPTVLCLNDQGGRVMEVSENATGTLRAQEHGHQPLVLYENHGLCDSSDKP